MRPHLAMIIPAGAIAPYYLKIFAIFILPVGHSQGII
jgi:hypothetical protein